MVRRVALAGAALLLMLPAVAVAQAGGPGMPGGAAPGTGAGAPGGGAPGPGGRGQGRGAPPDPGPPVREEIRRDQRAGADPHRSNPASLPSEAEGPGGNPGRARAGGMPGRGPATPGRGRGPAPGDGPPGAGPREPAGGMTQPGGP